MSQNVAVLFESLTWSEVLKKSEKENKIIFLDAYTSLCSPCKRMEKEVFTNDTVGKFYNDNFINFRMDMEKGDGIEISKKYNVEFYPSFLF
jgi:uncharacterized protein YyaL (SSP411 family)